MKIKIEIDSSTIRPREYAVRTITKEIVKTGIKEKQVWYNEEAIQTELENAGTGRLVRCWLKNVWPLPQLRILRSKPTQGKEDGLAVTFEESTHEFALDDSQDDNLTEEERRKWSFCPVVYKENDGGVAIFAPGSDVIRFRNKEIAKKTIEAIEDLFDRV